MPSDIQISRVTLLALMVFAIPLSAVADITMQEQGTLNVSEVHLRTTSRFKIAGEKGRRESDLTCQGPASSLCGKNPQIEIVRLDRGVLWQLDPTKKRYAETSFPALEERGSTAAQAHKAAENTNSCPQLQPAAVDISKCELSDPIASMEITNDVAEFAGQTAKRTIFKLTQACKNTEPSKACEVAFSFEVWLATDDAAGLNERQAFGQHYFNLLGVDNGFYGTPPQINEYLAPYHAALERLAQSSTQLKGYPLKSTFRLTYAGQPCMSAHSSIAGGRGSSAISGASAAATQATSNSAQHAVGWETADAMQRSTGSGIAGYVAGSAAGAFAGSMVSGLFARKTKAQAPSSNPVIAPKEAGATLLEYSLETTSLSFDPVAVAQFEAPDHWFKVDVATSRDRQLRNCPAGAL